MLGTATSTPSKSKLCIKSWNVLHLIHELNHVKPNVSPVIKKYLVGLGEHGKVDYGALETKRLAEMASIIQKEMDASSVLCLQEVPGDLLKLLASMAAKADFELFNYKYVREPRLKTDLKDSKLYTDSSEHLVSLVPKSCLPRAGQVVQFDDPGKACMGVWMNNSTLSSSAPLTKSNELCVLNVHLPYGEVAAGRALQAVAKTHLQLPGARHVLVGDMNMLPNQLIKVMRNIKEYGNNMAVHAPAQSTRKGVGSDGGVYFRTLDFYIASKTLRIDNVAVDANLDCSDHCLIRALVHL